MQVNSTYVGRFAPSPTGPLHFGSLVAALASFLDARHHNGRWLVRIEDLDPPREIDSAPAQIFRQLEYFGLEWDDDPLFQSDRLEAYEASLARLEAKGLLFSCTCSRRSYGAVYPGTCRHLARALDSRIDGQRTGQAASATRIRIENREIQFTDLFQSTQRFDLETQNGDFILKRKDGLFAYQLAVVVDDDAQGITHIIRGNDLLDSTPKQLYLADQLDFKRPIYGHFPVVLGEDGHKLSKQAKASPIALEDPCAALNMALKALGQTPISTSSVTFLLRQAVQNWDRQQIPKVAGVSINSLSL